MNYFLVSSFLSMMIKKNFDSTAQQRILSPHFCCCCCLVESKHGELICICHWLHVWMRDGLECDELWCKVIALNVYECALVAARVAVVGRREDGDALSILHHLVALGLDLVRTNDVVEAVLLQEGLGDVGTVLDAHASLRLGAAVRVLRVRPHQIAHEAVLGRLSVAVDLADVVQRHVVLAKEAAVHHHHFRVDAVTQRDLIEDLREQVEHLLRVL